MFLFIYFSLQYLLNKRLNNELVSEFGSLIDTLEFQTPRAQSMIKNVFERCGIVVFINDNVKLIEI
jgi:hypothetical protein